MVRIVGRMAAMLVISAACAASASSGNPAVRMRVQDPKGGMIAKAFVVMHHEWDEQANEGAAEHHQNELMRAQFDGTADYVITVKPGFFDVYVLSRGFDPNCSKVHIAPGTDRALVFPLVENKWIYASMVE